MAMPVPIGGGPESPGAAPVLAPAGGLPAPGAGISGARSLRRMARAITSNRKATVGAGLLAIFLIVSIIPGVFAKDDPNAEVYPRSLGPSGQHLLGTTSFGQDMFAQVIYGTRPVLLIALGVGVGTMLKGGNPRRSNKMMQMRVLMQAVALVVLALLMMMAANK